ncbi:MAG: ribosome maturation factor RimP [Rubrobacteridae bacterium]|nr:ribosome maturation factor RimP [Rubrobacteridae bacterium]
MNRDSIIGKIEQTIEPILKRDALELVAIELSREAVGLVLRIYLDTVEGGIGLDEIAKASQTINPLLDEAGLIEQKYTLEVSSPGIERPLTKPDHFKRFTGSKVFVKTQKPIENRKQFKGKLVEARDEDFVVEIDDKSYVIAYENVSKARLQIDIKF